MSSESEKKKNDKDEKRDEPEPLRPRTDGTSKRIGAYFSARTGADEHAAAEKSEE